MNQASSVYLIVALVLSLATCLRIKVPCDTYKVTSTSIYTHQHHLEMLGVYKIEYKHRCFHRPVYKHMTTDRYIHLNQHSHWSITNKQNLEGDSTNKSSCAGESYAHALQKSPWKTPNKSGWRIYDESSKNWLEDDSLSVSCVCSYFIVTSDNPSMRFNAPFVLGRYHIVSGFLCNNHVIYKHVHNDRYMYVDENNKWTVSNSDELYGIGRTTTCSRFGYVHNPKRPATQLPDVSGWKFYVSKENRWVSDDRMKVSCEY